MKGFDATFLLQVMRGEKKCLPVGFQTGFNLNYFLKGETLNKSYIINKISNNPKFSEYLPDNIFKSHKPIYDLLKKVSCQDENEEEAYIFWNSYIKTLCCSFHIRWKSWIHLVPISLISKAYNCKDKS